ncbi:MAG: hypothetical protein IKV45_01125 [Firmicutes bacterium]|nr:hypothetical protein [Bacillota bacterium]
MKKQYWLWMLALIFCVSFAACGEKGQQPLMESSDDKLMLGAWGENQNVSIAEKDDGSVWVVNDAGEDVLDVSGFVQTDILGDEFTGEPRLIKTYTSAGYAEAQLESDYNEEIEIFTMNYYDTFGNLLLKDSPYHLVSIAGNYGYTRAVDWNNSNCVFYLPTGTLISEGGNVWPLDHGIAVSSDTGTATAFYDESGTVIRQADSCLIVGYLSDFNRSDPDSNSCWGHYYSFRSLLEQYGESSELYALKFEKEPGRSEYYDYVDSVMGAPQKQDDLLLFAEQIGSEYLGLVDEKGNVVLKGEYEGYAACGDDTIVAFGSVQTDLYSRADFSLAKTLPHKMTCYDGENSVLQIAEYSYYFADAEGNVLSEMNNGVQRVDMEENGVCFVIDLPESDDMAVVDRSGTVLYTLPFDPSLIYVGNDSIAIRSHAGEYLIDCNGNITRVFQIWDGYTYDESSNTISVNTQ